MERVRTSPDHGNEVRVFVKAQNFATQGQKYSLAITGCFDQQPPPSTTTSATTPSSQFQQQELDRFSSNDLPVPVSSPPSCPSSRRLQIELRTIDDGPQLAWNLIKSLEGGGVRQIVNGPSSNSAGYQNRRLYTASACLRASSDTKYRFQLRNTRGNPIKSRYKLTYGGQVIVSTQWSSVGQLGKTSTFRFKVSSKGNYQQLGSNTGATNIQWSEMAEIGVDGDSPPTYYSSVSGNVGDNSMDKIEIQEQGYEDGGGEDAVGSLDHLYLMDDDDEDSMDSSGNESVFEDTRADNDGSESVGSIDYVVSMDHGAEEYYGDSDNKGREDEDVYRDGEGGEYVGSVDEHYAKTDSEVIYEDEGEEAVGSMDHLLSMKYNTEEHESDSSEIVTVRTEELHGNRSNNESDVYEGAEGGEYVGSVDEHYVETDSEEIYEGEGEESVGSNDWLSSMDYDTEEHKSDSNVSTIERTEELPGDRSKNESLENSRDGSSI